MTPIPLELRERILQLYQQGKSTREIAELLGFSVAAVRRVRQQFLERGTLEPRTHRSGRRTLLTDERKRRLEEMLARRPDATLAELEFQLDRRFAISTIDLWLRRMGWRLKKKPGRRRKRAARYVPRWRRGAARPFRRPQRRWLRWVREKGPLA